MNMRDVLLNAKENDSYQRIDPTHPVAWYLGLDSSGNYSLFCITETRPQNLTSTQTIQVFLGKRKDNKYGITFSLKEKAYANLFIHFCEDMVDATRYIADSKKVADAVCGRYIQWQKAFKKTSGDLLGFEVVKGLIGELVFLRDRMIQKYGPEKGLHGWSGIDYTDRDFTYEDTWYEVKSTVSGGTSVRISSVEQLDVAEAGHLAVIYLDKTTREDTGRITLNSLFNQISETMDSVVLREEFRSRMLEFGYYPDDAYDDLCFSFHGIKLYRVSKDFPCLRKDSVPAAVTDVEYKLSLSAIDTYREE